MEFLLLFLLMYSEPDFDVEKGNFVIWVYQPADQDIELVYNKSWLTPPQYLNVRVSRSIQEGVMPKWRVFSIPKKKAGVSGIRLIQGWSTYKVKHNGKIIKE